MHYSFFSKCLLSTYWEPGTVLYSGDKMINKKQFLYFWGWLRCKHNSNTTILAQHWYRMWGYMGYVADVLSNFQICFFLSLLSSSCHCFLCKLLQCLLYWSWFCFFPLIYLPEYLSILFPKWCCHFPDESFQLTYTSCIKDNWNSLAKHVRPFVI